MQEANGKQVDYNISSFFSLTVDPNNPQIIYAGDIQDGVFASTNSGTTWSQQSVGLPLPISIFALVFDDPGKKLYAATNSGIFVSANATIKWVHLSGLPVDSYSSVAFDLNASHVIYVASESHRAYVSGSRCILDCCKWSVYPSELLFIV